jgi:hypothetical protein
VKRKERFCERHPEVRFTDSRFGWHATYRDPSDGGLKTTAGYFLLDPLLDFLERLYGELLCSSFRR